MNLRVAVLSLVLVLVCTEELSHQEILKNAGLHNVLMSTNWREIVQHVNKHWHEMEATDINTQNKFLESALNMGSDYFGNARKLQSLAHELHSFVHTHGSTMPGSTLNILSTKANQLHKLAMQLDQAKRMKSVGDEL